MIIEMIIEMIIGLDPPSPRRQAGGPRLRWPGRGDHLAACVIAWQMAGGFLKPISSVLLAISGD